MKHIQTRICTHRDEPVHEQQTQVLLSSATTDVCYKRELGLILLSKVLTALTFFLPKN